MKTGSGPFARVEWGDAATQPYLVSILPALFSTHPITYVFSSSFYLLAFSTSWPPLLAFLLGPSHPAPEWKGQSAAATPFAKLWSFSVQFSLPSPLIKAPDEDLGVGCASSSSRAREIQRYDSIVQSRKVPLQWQDHRSNDTLMTSWLFFCSFTLWATAIVSDYHAAFMLLFMIVRSQPSRFLVQQFSWLLKQSSRLPDAM